MSKIEERELLVVRSVVLSKEGQAVKVTKLELSQKGVEMLRSQSNGIWSKQDDLAKHEDLCLQAASA